MQRRRLSPARWRSAVCAVLLCAVLLCAAPVAQALTANEVFKQASPSVWRIRSYDKEGLPLSFGSAVVVGPQQLITNCHVLRKASRFVVLRDKLSFPGTLEMWDAPRDLCQVKAAIGDVPAAKLADSASLTVGQNVYALGSPEGMELTLSAGLISSLRRDASDRLVMIQTSAPISPGSSGGGLFDDRGRLIGVTTMTAAANGAQNLNFALPADWVRELPQRHAEARAKAGAQAAGASAAASGNAPAAPVEAATAGPGGRVPFLDEAGQTRFQRYRSEVAPKAFAISDNGFFGVAVSRMGRTEFIDAKERALRNCSLAAGRACTLYAVDDTIVYRP